MDLPSVGDRYNVFVPYREIADFVGESDEQNIFFYHSHPHVKPSVYSAFTGRDETAPINCLSPPSVNDLAVNMNLRKVHGERIKTRMVEKFGVWEYFANDISGFSWLTLLAKIGQTKTNDKLFPAAYDDICAQVTFRPF